MLNRHQILGHVVHDPVLRHTRKGTPVTNLLVATNETYKDHDGQFLEHTEFHKVTAWRATAENVARRLGQGDQVLLAGPVRRHRSESGNTIYFDSVITLGGRHSHWQLLRKRHGLTEPAEPDEANEPPETDDPADETPSEAPQD